MYARLVYFQRRLKFNVLIKGVRHENRLRPLKFNNTQLNFAPNLLHLAPPTVRAHCKNLKKFGTKFPKEYKDNYSKMRDDFPLEFHTTVC